MVGVDRRPCLLVDEDEDAGFAMRGISKAEARTHYLYKAFTAGQHDA